MMTKIIAVCRTEKKGLGKFPQALSIDTTPSLKKKRYCSLSQDTEAMTLFPYTRLSSSSIKEKSSLAFPL